MQNNQQHVPHGLIRSDICGNVFLVQIHFLLSIRRLDSQIRLSCLVISSSRWTTSRHKPYEQGKWLVVMPLSRICVRAALWSSVLWNANPIEATILRVCKLSSVSYRIVHTCYEEDSSCSIRDGATFEFYRDPWLSVLCERRKIGSCFSVEILGLDLAECSVDRKKSNAGQRVHPGRRRR